MSIRTKGRRKILVGEQHYIWYVAPDEESPYDLLHIASEDKTLMLACPLGTKTAYAISQGRIFQKEKTDGCWHRYLLPSEMPDAITPGFVRQVILWATEATGAESVSRHVPV